MSTDQDAFGHASKGLDRGKLHVYTSVESTGGGNRNGIDASADGDVSTDNRTSPIAKIKQLSRDVRRRFHRETKEATVLPSNDQGTSDQTTISPILAPAPPRTSEQDRFFDAPPQKISVPPLKDFVKSPVRTAKTIAHSQGGNDLAKNLGKPDASHEASVRVVRAYDNLAETVWESDEDLALKDLELLKKARQDAFVRWTLDRHVKKVGRCQLHQIPMKPRTDFVVCDQHGKKVTQWNAYGAHLLHFYLERYGGSYIAASSGSPNPTEGALMAGIERVILTSTPLQQLYMRMRSIAHWQDPLKSATCTVLYFVLVYQDYVVRAGLLYALFLVLKRRCYPPDITDMRQELELAEDRDATATDISQHIDRHGRHRWFDALIEKAGPTILSQIEDIADLLEIWLNFYEWRDPKRTAFTLCLMAISWLGIAIMPLWLLIRSLFLAVGINFFVLMPITHRYPKYRLLLSPTVWMFWKVPTHSEWAIARVQAEATQKLATLRLKEQVKATDICIKDTAPSPNSDPMTLSSDDTLVEENLPRPSSTRVGRYHCTSEKHYGSLCISTDAVSFESTISANQRWVVRYETMQSIHKVDGKTTVIGGDALLFTDVGGREFQVSGLKNRGVVFSQIVGYSNVRWQKAW